MLRIRLQRLGRRHRPFYRLNAIDQRTRREGRVIEALGHYDPMFPDASKQVVLKGDAIRKWLDLGAQPSETVRDLLARNGILNDAEMKAWEAERATQRDRVEVKKAISEIEASIKAMDAAGAEAEAVNPAKRSLNVAKRLVSAGKADEARKLASEVKGMASKAAPAKAEGGDDASAE